MKFERVKIESTPFRPQLHPYAQIIAMVSELKSDEAVKVEVNGNREALRKYIWEYGRRRNISVKTRYENGFLYVARKATPLRIPNTHISVNGIARGA